MESEPSVFFRGSVAPWAGAPESEGSLLVLFQRCKHVHIPTSIQKYIHIHIYTHVYECMCIYMYIHMQVLGLYMVCARFTRGPIRCM